ncbi:MAG: hypothetical protein RI554_08370 [Trueperaceae bacterium]|nr:hypothetical protein [Trueperaceae bacterium]
MTFLPDPWTLLLAALATWIVSGLLAPLETLGWWAGWFGRNGDDPGAPGPLLDEEPPPDAASDPADAPPPHPVPHDAWVVFLSGIHVVEDQTFAPLERAFLQRLRRDLPGTAVLEVFPYSVTNRALTGQRAFAWFWRRALRWKRDGRRLAGLVAFAINVRNGWQVAVSTDRRYGPMYDQGSARLIERALRRAGFDPADGAPVVLVGYSGGGQVALGAAPVLASRFSIPLQVVSLGGVLASPRTLEGVERVLHLRGRNDAVARLSTWFFPGRWWFASWSTWNRGKAEGIVQVEDLGAMDHTGGEGYLDPDTSLPDGRSHQTATAQAIARAVRHARHGRDAAPHDADGVARPGPTPNR